MSSFTAPRLILGKTRAVGAVALVSAASPRWGS